MDPEKAVKIAREYDPAYNFCTEYPDAWVFSVNDGVERIGGSGSPLAVMKDTLESVGMPEYTERTTAEPVIINQFSL